MRASALPVGRDGGIRVGGYRGSVKAQRVRPDRRRRSRRAPVSALGIAVVLGAAVLAPTAAQASQSTQPAQEASASSISAPAVMPAIDPAVYRAQALGLPAELVSALARDLDLTPEEYLARSDAAIQAAEVVESLGDDGVDVLASRLDGTRLVVNVDSPEAAAAVESAGAVAELGEPEARVDYSTIVLKPMADLVGGQGYTFATLNGSQRVNHVCSVAFNGVSKSTGQKQFLTAGHCLTGGRQDDGVLFEARQSAAGGTVTRGSTIGTPIESSFHFGGGVDAGLVATASGWTPRSLVSTWGGSTGAVGQGTPVAITQTSPGIVGAPLCKSGRTTGWTCGEILDLNFPTQVYNGNTGLPVIVNLTLTSACMLEGDSGSAAVIGSAGFGVGTAGSFVGSCSTASQPDAISAFFPLVTTDGSASVTSALPDWQLQTGSPYGNDWSPLGNFENASAGFTTTNLRGWAFDPDTPEPTQVHVYIGGNFLTGAWGGAYSAKEYRPDVGTALPGAGGNRGFSIDLPTRPGSTQYCLYAINVGAGSTTDLGCKTVASPTGPPVGNFESATLTGTSATLIGWTIDPDTAASIPVHVYVNGAWSGAYTADSVRPDVGASYRGYGNAHGFAIVNVRVPIGTSTVCIYGIDQGGTKNTQLGCRTVSTGSGPPKGSLDNATAGVGTIAVTGWALDPDTAAPVAVHVYVDGAWAGQFTANTSRPDVGRAYPGYGDGHGYVGTVAASGGNHSVCVYAINIGAGGSNPLLSCRTVRVPGGNPVGNFEAAVRSGNTVSVKGWSIDPDSVGAVTVHFYADGLWVGQITADAVRADVGKAYPAYGTKHGFQGAVSVPAGAKRLCAYGINIGSGSTNPELGCIAVP
jgi:hypothetical protein